MVLSLAKHGMLLWWPTLNPEEAFTLHGHPQAITSPVFVCVSYVSYTLVPFDI